MRGRGLEDIGFLAAHDGEAGRLPRIAGGGQGKRELMLHACNGDMAADNLLG